MKTHAWMPAMVAAGLLAGCSQPMTAAPTAAAPAPMAAADPTPVTVGGSPMLASKTIVANAVNSNDNKTLVAAVKAAGLVDTLNGPGPFTVFAPTDEAFAALPKGTVATLLKPVNKPTLTKILTYHVVPGTMDFASLSRAVTAAGGTLTLTTVAGLPLTVTLNGPHNLLVTDAKGGVAHITTYDVYQSNGVIQIVDKVLLPG